MCEANIKIAKMSDYSKAVIYKIYCKDITVLEFYIGSTHDEHDREIQHKSDCNNENSEKYNKKAYEFIRENGGWDKWKFEVIEEYPCDNDIQLKTRERYHYDLLKPVLNTNKPFITEEERKEYYAKYNSEYREEHTEYYAKYNAEYNVEHREEHKIRDAINYQKNKEKINEYCKNYKEKNREALECIAKQKHNCECGGKYTHQHRARHCDSKKHKKFIENQNQTM